MFGFIKRRRRQKVRHQPFPASWRLLLARQFPIYSRLPGADQRDLEGHIQVFLAEKKFEGCGGFQVTDEVRVLIAAQACLLLLHRETDYYPRLRSIVVYPEAYVAKTRWREGDEDTGRESRARLGESWQTGAVVLAWSSALSGAVNPADGQNVTLHEFAHQLDQEDGAADGVPPLAAEGFLQRRGRYLAWARVMRPEFERLQEGAGRGHKTVLDQYGASNPPEFFAVATECFFEKPRQLRKKHPALYDELSRFYQLDPAAFADPTPSENSDQTIARDAATRTSKEDSAH